MINRSRLSPKLFEAGWDRIIPTSFNDYRTINSIVSQRLGWIFGRRESNGVVRRDLEPFSRAMLEERLSRQANHPLNSDFARYYDWDFKDTDIVLRFEVPYQRDPSVDPYRANFKVYVISITHNGVVCKIDCAFEPWEDNPYGWSGRYFIADARWNVQN